MRRVVRGRVPTNVLGISAEAKYVDGELVDLRLIREPGGPAITATRVVRLVSLEDLRKAVFASHTGRTSEFGPHHPLWEGP